MKTGIGWPVVNFVAPSRCAETTVQRACRLPVGMVTSGSRWVVFANAASRSRRRETVEAGGLPVGLETFIQRRRAPAEPSRAPAKPSVGAAGRCLAPARPCSVSAGGPSGLPGGSDGRSPGGRTPSESARQDAISAGDERPHAAQIACYTNHSASAAAKSSLQRLERFEQRLERRRERERERGRGQYRVLSSEDVNWRVCVCVCESLSVRCKYVACILNDGPALSS